MAITNNIKFYSFINILFKYSDENNILTLENINNHLKSEIGATIERKALYRYIEDVKQLGIDISDYKENGKGYYVRDQKLEEHEIKILLDCIAASKSITAEKTEALSKKLCKLNNVYVEYGLNRQVYINNRAKSKNQQIFICIDAINKAIRDEKKISFHYSYYNEYKELVLKKDNEGKDKEYIANPIAMVLKDDYYYLILNIDKRNDLANYRIDKMKSVKILDEPRKKLSKIENCGEKFDPATYARKCIKMFMGQEKHIELEVEKYVLGFIIDELGSDINVRLLENGNYNVIFSCIYGKGLIKWLLQLGSSVKVISPYELKEELIKELKNTIELY